MPGRGGAPKFFLDWLTFAFSPYDPDHIPAPPASLRNDTLPLLHVDDSPSVLHKELGKFSSNNYHVIKQVQARNVKKKQRIRKVENLKSRY